MTTTTIKDGRGRARGFTLVEMLIVIVIVAILAGLLMVAASSAIRSAEDARAVADMTNIRRVMMVLLTENDINRENLRVDVKDNSIDIQGKLTSDKKEALEKGLKSSIDNILNRKFRIWYTVSGDLGNFIYYPKEKDRPQYFSINNTWGTHDMTIYCYDDENNVLRTVKSY